MGSSDGKIAEGPCGHPHKFIFNQFSLCTWNGCDGKAKTPRCPKCSSSDVRTFDAPMCPSGSFACGPCGAVWHPGY